MLVTCSSAFYLQLCGDVNTKKTKVTKTLQRIYVAPKSLFAVAMCIIFSLGGLSP